MFLQMWMSVWIIPVVTATQCAQIPLVVFCALVKLGSLVMGQIIAVVSEVLGCTTGCSVGISDVHLVVNIIIVLTDIDECSMGEDMCLANSTCSNTIGSYECNCDSGFIGDGFIDCSSNVICSLSYCK